MVQIVIPSKMTQTHIDEIKKLKTWKEKIEYANKYKEHYLLEYISILVAEPWMKDEHLKKFKNLTSLNCKCNTNFSDNSLKTLTKLTTLFCGLNQNFTNESLCELHKLTILDCGTNDKFTDIGLVNISKLLVLRCGLCKFTDRIIKELKSLLVLDCGKNTILTDVGIKNLKVVTLYFGDSLFTTECIEKLKNNGVLVKKFS
jgi:hypothetical protein